MLLLSWLIPGNAFFEGSEYCSCNLQRAASIYYYDARRRDRARGCCKNYCDNVITERSSSEGLFLRVAKKKVRKHAKLLWTPRYVAKKIQHYHVLKKSRIRPKAFPIKIIHSTGGQTMFAKSLVKKKIILPKI